MTEEGNGPSETNLTAETAPPFSKPKPRKPPRAEEASKEDDGGKAAVEAGAAEQKPAPAPEKPAAAPEKPPAIAEKPPATPSAQAAGGTVNKAKDQAAPKVMSTAERMRFRRRH